MTTTHQDGAVPLVTFALICYNQQAFVKEAIFGAFSQTYQPLQILLSDDNSTDDTFRVMQDSVSGYEGPHQVIILRNEANLGITEHVNAIIERADSDIIVLAAGDDVSVPERTAIGVDFLIGSQALLVHSDVSEIYEGPMRPFHRDKITMIRNFSVQECAISTALYFGATAILHRDIFRIFGPLPRGDLYEDLILGFRAVLMNRVVFIPKKLVNYRIGNGVSTGRVYSIRRWLQWRRNEISRFRRTLNAREIDLGRINHLQQAELSLAIQAEIRAYTVRAAIYGDVDYERTRGNSFFRDAISAILELGQISRMILNLFTGFIGRQSK